MGYGKYVNLVFVGAAAVVWFLSQHYVDVGVGYFQLARRIGSFAEVLKHALPIVFALATLITLRWNTKVHNFVSDAMSELISVVFPGPDEVRKGTIVVIITVLMSGVILGVLDMGITAFVRSIIGA